MKIVSHRTVKKEDKSVIKKTAPKKKMEPVKKSLITEDNPFLALNKEIEE